jgi:hypothetical protein
MLLLSAIIFLAALVTRWMFLWDVRPVSWDYAPPPTSAALDAAFFLLSIQNVAAVVAVISLGWLCVLSIRRRRHSFSQITRPEVKAIVRQPPHGTSALPPKVDIG